MKRMCDDSHYSKLLWIQISEISSLHLVLVLELNDPNWEVSYTTLLCYKSNLCSNHINVNSLSDYYVSKWDTL